MKKYIKSPIIALFAGVSAIAILGDSSAFAQNRYGTPTTNHVPPAQFKAHHMRPMVNHGSIMSQNILYTLATNLTLLYPARLSSLAH